MTLHATRERASAVSPSPGAAPPVVVAPRSETDIAAIADACPVPVRCFDEIDSTSLEARRIIGREPPPGGPLVVLAAVQTGGLGRLGRPWSSPRGGLWLTLLLPLPDDYNVPAETALLHIRLAVAVRESIVREQAAALALEPVTIKWPNDIMVTRRGAARAPASDRPDSDPADAGAAGKAAGILTEIVRPSADASRAFLLVGVGVNSNLSADDLPESLRGSATTLRDAFGVAIDQRRLLANITRRVLAAAAPSADEDARTIRDGVALNLARRCLYRLKQTITVSLPDASITTGVLTGLSHDGRPILRLPNEKTWTPPPGAGEVFADPPSR